MVLLLVTEWWLRNVNIAIGVFVLLRSYVSLFYSFFFFVYVLYHAGVTLVLAPSIACRFRTPPNACGCKSSANAERERQRDQRKQRRCCVFGERERNHSEWHINIVAYGRIATESSILRCWTHSTDSTTVSRIKSADEIYVIHDDQHWYTLMQWARITNMIKRKNSYATASGSLCLVIFQIRASFVKYGTNNHTLAFGIE